MMSMAEGKGGFRTRELRKVLTDLDEIGKLELSPGILEHFSLLSLKM